MSGLERHVVLGLARARTGWFGDVSRWSTSGLVAVEFVKTVSVDEVRARLESGRRFSVLLVDAAMPGLDRDLFETARSVGVATVVIGRGAARDWLAAGAATVVPAPSSAGDLTTLLAQHSSPVDPLDRIPGTSAPTVPQTGFRAPVVAVTGVGGAGTSTIAAAVAQGTASDPAHSGSALLADLALDADQGVLHDVGDVLPGLLELAERHRAGVPSPDVVRSLTFDLPERGYRLLLGLRRHRDWTALRPHSLQMALDGLRRTFSIVVADIDADFEGEPDTGSVDVEDRNRLARTVLELADVMVVIGSPGVLGIHGLLRCLRRCRDAGFPTANIVPVLNRVPRRRRAEAVAAATALLGGDDGAETLSPVVVPERAEVERSLRDGTPLPRAVVDAVTPAVTRRLEAVHGSAPPSRSADSVPVPVAVGSLGEWAEG